MITAHNGVKAEQEVLIDGVIVKQKRFPILYEMETTGYDFVDQYGFLREDALVAFVKRCGFQITIRNEGRGPGRFLVDIFSPGCSQFEVGKTYKTKFQTGELFTLTKDPYKRKDGLIIGIENTALGIYENSQELGVCPLSTERLILPIIPQRDILHDRVDFHSMSWTENILTLLKRECII